jgi:phosphate/phosphite/phosphonate ABC transporter binding protein
MKRFIVPLVFVGVIAGLAFFGFRDRDRPPEMKVEWEFATVPEFVIGVLPYRADEEILQDLGPLVSYFEKHLKKPVKLNIAVDYHSLGRLLDLGKIQLAWFSHALFEQSAGKDGWEVLCRPDRRGLQGHRGVIVVKEDAPWTDLRELGGKRFAYVDRLSGSGFLYPARIMRDLGMDPVASFSEVIFTGNHTRCIEAILAGTVDAAAIFSDTPLDASGTAGVPAGLRALVWTPWIPSDPLAVRRDMDTGLKVHLRDLLTNMSEREFGPETVAALKGRRGFDAFRPEPGSGTRHLLETLAE